jgi:hypothetical protein
MIRKRQGVIAGVYDNSNNLSLITITPAIIFCQCRVVYTSEQLIPGAVDTGNKYKTTKISRKFSKKLETATMGYSGARGKLIHEKT